MGILLGRSVLSRQLWQHWSAWAHLQLGLAFHGSIISSAYTCAHPSTATSTHCCRGSADPELAHQICQKKFKAFHDRPAFLVPGFGKRRLAEEANIATAKCDFASQAV